MVSFNNTFFNYNNTYLKTDFIKILDILIKKFILIIMSIISFKLGLNKHRIIAFSTLVVIFAIIFGL